MVLIVMKKNPTLLKCISWLIVTAIVPVSLAGLFQTGYRAAEELLKVSSMYQDGWKYAHVQKGVNLRPL